MRYDYVIVGAGPAGCVLASRLSEEPSRHVLLIDAGPDYGSDPANWPPELLDTSGPALGSHSWNISHREDPHGRRLSLPRGKVFGGCSAVNSCIWLHGSRADYDGWAALGNRGWDFNTLQPLFAGAESDSLHDPVSRGDHLVDVWRTPPERLSRIDVAILESADELGIARVDDLNGSEIQFPSCGPTPKNVRDGLRLNGALTYLAQARTRGNLHILPATLVDRVMLNERAAVGIVTSDGEEINSAEVILCSGAYGSPAILLRTGIGQATHLREMNIPVAIDLPGVGESLMDHPYLAPYTSGRTSFIIGQSGHPDHPSFIQTMIKARSRQVDEEIDLHLYPREQRDEHGRWLLGFGVSLQRSRSRGRVRLTSVDPNAELDIDHRYFSDPIDLEALTDGVELLDRLVRTRPLADLIEGPAQDDSTADSRTAIQEVIKRDVGTTFHPSSSCRMGPDSDRMAVVDEHARVRGTRHLRVVDASIFPAGPRCNLHAPTVAVAERVANLMLTDS